MINRVLATTELLPARSSKESQFSFARILVVDNTRISKNRCEFMVIREVYPRYSRHKVHKSNVKPVNGTKSALGG